MQSRYLLGSVAILGALGFLVFSSLQSGTLQSVPVGTLRSPGKEAGYIGKRLRMVGFVGSQKVTKAPQQTDNGVINLQKFMVLDDLTHSKTSVTVLYSDALPDTFRAGGPVQVDGIYTAPGQMRADHVLTKCPSKYQAEAAANDAKKQQGKPAEKSASAKSAESLTKVAFEG